MDGARGIANSFGIPEFVIGATVVAVGTSMPELATTLISKLRGHDEIGLGAVFGSNIFNGLFIVGVAAAIYPIKVDMQAVGPALLFGVVATAMLIPGATLTLGRLRGGLLLVLYVAYTALLFQSGHGSH